MDARSLATCLRSGNASPSPLLIIALGFIRYRIRSRNVPTTARPPPSDLHLIDKGEAAVIDANPATHPAPEPPPTSIALASSWRRWVQIDLQQRMNTE